MIMFIVRFKNHDELEIESRHYGPFSSYDDAYEFLCMLPAPTYSLGDSSGYKFIVELDSPHG